MYIHAIGLKQQETGHNQWKSAWNIAEEVDASFSKTEDDSSYLAP
jgi:hypothetical protein